MKIMLLNINLTFENNLLAEVNYLYKKNGGVGQENLNASHKNNLASI